ncbi:hypothetical protein ACFKHW_30250 [Bradyrhizobium lupini]|uniref:hypothetical protein n=1 Tax=Rhizobium lupini TaxID=136996 RepID=UPI00366E93AF
MITELAAHQGRQVDPKFWRVRSALDAVKLLNQVERGLDPRILQISATGQKVRDFRACLSVGGIRIDGRILGVERGGEDGGTDAASRDSAYRKQMLLKCRTEILHSR